MMRVRLMDQGRIMTWSAEVVSVGHDSRNAIFARARLEEVDGKPTNSQHRFERVVIPLSGISSLTEEPW